MLPDHGAEKKVASKTDKLPQTLAAIAGMYLFKGRVVF